MSRASGEPPFVSVVMPVRNEGEFIERSLGAVLAQDYPPERFEVLVVDGMSDDGTRDLVERFRETTRRPPIRLLDNPGKTAPRALNVGLAAARGEVIVRVDGHCEIAEDYLTRSVEALEAHDAGCVGGPIETIGEGAVSRAIAIAMSSRFGVGGSPFRVGASQAREVDSVAFPAWPRAVMEAAGPFDEELVRNQDDEYSYRLRKLGHRIMLVPEIRCRYYSRGSLGSLWRQYFQYGFWKVRVLQKHPRQMRLRQFVPPVFVAFLLIAGLLAWTSAGAAMLAAGAGLYLAAAAVATAASAGRAGRYAILLPGVFACLHLSYGAGFLAGLARFWNRGRWRDRAGKLGLLVLSTALSLLAAEGLIRAWAPQQLIVLRPDIWQPDDGLGWTQRSGVDTVVNTGERPVRLLTDDQGHRVGHRPGRGVRAEPTRRILALGDSYLVALQVDYAQTFTALTEQRLSRAFGEAVEIVNTGVGGWGPSHYLLKARRELARQRYDLVMVFFYLGNDVETRRVEHFEPKQATTRHRFRWPRDATAGEVIGSFLRPVNDVLETRSHLFILVKKRLWAVLMRLRLSARRFPEVLLREEASAERWRISAEACRAVAGEAAAKGLRTIFVLLPGVCEVDAEIAEASARAAGIDPRDVDLTLPPGGGGRLVMQRPREKIGDRITGMTRQAMFGPYPDVPNPFMGGSYQPKFMTAELCAGCHQQNQDALLEGSSLDPARWPDGLPTHSTFEEWQAGPFTATPCQGCHMPPKSGMFNSVDVASEEDAGITFGFGRSPDRLRSHSFRGPLMVVDGMPRLLDGAAMLDVVAGPAGGQLEVTTTVENVGCGHALPTGEPMRALLLVLRVEGCGVELPQTAGATLDDLAGSLESGVIGSDATIAGSVVTWPAGAAKAQPGQLVRVVRASGSFIDYEGPGFFSDPDMPADQKGFEIDAAVGRGAVVSVVGPALTLDASIAAQPGDRIVLVDPLPAAFVDGDPSLALGGASGMSFSRVLVDPAGRRRVPHHRAVDMVRDNRLSPMTPHVASHAFTIEPGCTEATVTATLLYRPHPLDLSKERGWDARDWIVRETAITVPTP